jgi:hypothetical protein
MNAVRAEKPLSRVEIDPVLAGHVPLRVEVGRERIRDSVLRRENVRPERSTEMPRTSTSCAAVGRISPRSLLRLAFEQVGEISGVEEQRDVLLAAVVRQGDVVPDR